MGWNRAYEKDENYSFQILSTLGAVFFVEDAGAESNFFGDGFAFEDLKRVVYGFCAAGWILERGVENSLFDVSDAFLRKGVDANEFHLFFASGGLSGEESAVRAGIIVGIDAIDVGEAGEGGFHFFAGIRFEPLHVGFEDDFDAASSDGLTEAGITILARSGGHEAFKFDEFAFAAEFIDDPIAGGVADFFVISTDKACEFVAEESAVEDDDGDVSVHCFGDGFGEGLGLFGADDDEVDAGADEFFDMRALFERVVLGVFENDFEFGVFIGGGFDLGVHFDAPGFAEIALGHADGVTDMCRSPVRYGSFGGFGLFAAGEESDGGKEKELEI